MQGSVNLPNNVPEWFCTDKDSGIADMDIQDKIRIEIFNELVNQNCSFDLWTEDFIDEVANMYFIHYDRKYNEFCMKQLQTYMSRNKLLNAFDANHMVNPRDNIIGPQIPRPGMSPYKPQ